MPSTRIKTATDLLGDKGDLGKETNMIGKFEDRYKGILKLIVLDLVSVLSGKEYTVTVSLDERIKRPNDGTYEYYKFNYTPLSKVAYLQRKKNTEIRVLLLKGEEENDSECLTV